VLFALGLTVPALAAPAMWQVSDANSSIWLFGSIHGLPKGDKAWRTPLLDQAIHDAGKIYFETDIGPAGIAAITVKTLVQSFAAAGQESWVPKLSTTDAERLSAALQPLGIDLARAGAMPPWLVAMQLSQVQMQRAGTPDLDFSSGVDFVLEWELPAERKGFFETPGEQFDMLAAGTVDEQVEGVVRALDALDDIAGDEMTQLVTAWTDGDIDALRALVESEGADDPAFIERLLDQRNRNWIPKMETMLRDDAQNLVIVGAAHLAGPGSVIDLLEKAGYTVKRIQ